MEENISKKADNVYKSGQREEKKLWNSPKNAENRYNPQNPVVFTRMSDYVDYRTYMD